MRGAGNPARGAGAGRSRHPTACPDDPRRPRPDGHRPDGVGATRRSRARRARRSRRASRSVSRGRPRTAPAAPIPRDGSPARPAPTGRPPWRSTHRDCGLRPPEVARSTASGATGTGRRSRSVTEPDPLVRLVDVGEGAGRSARNEAQRAAPVLVDPAPNAHRPGEWSAKPSASARTTTVRPASAGRDSSQ